MTTEVVSGATRVRRARSTTDPNTCLEVFGNHWDQTRSIMDQPQLPTHDEAEPVFHYLEQMMTLLMEEPGCTTDTPGPILNFCFKEQIFARLFAFSARCSGDLGERLRLHQLTLYDQLISQMKQPILHYEHVVRPLLDLLEVCALRSSLSVERRWVHLLHQLSVCVARDPAALACCGAGPLPVLGLLVPLVHRDGEVGRLARDALLLLLALSSRDESVATYVARDSDFCPVVATGLSGLYSSLPRKLGPLPEDWQKITQEFWTGLPDLVNFLASLDFCNLAMKVCHPMIREELLHYVYTGFLVPVVGSALHQSSLEEVVVATAYLELFLQRLFEPSLLRLFLRFVLVEKYDEYCILDSLITRLNSNSTLGIVTMSLFRTILNFHCEDVMYHLILRYLIPCEHLITNQDGHLQDSDSYAKSADKFLALVPDSCRVEAPAQVARTRRTSDSSTDTVARRRSSQAPGVLDHLCRLRTAYPDYLKDAAHRVGERRLACRHWQYCYDGTSPPAGVFGSGQDPAPSTAQHTFKKYLDTAAFTATSEFSNPLDDQYDDPLEVSATSNDFMLCSTPTTPQSNSVECNSRTDFFAESATNGTFRKADQDTGYYSSNNSLNKVYGASETSKARQIASMYRLSYFDDDAEETQDEPVENNTTPAPDTVPEEVEESSQDQEEPTVEDDVTAEMTLIREVQAAAQEESLDPFVEALDRLPLATSSHLMQDLLDDLDALVEGISVESTEPAWDPLQVEMMVEEVEEEEEREIVPLTVTDVLPIPAPFAFPPGYRVGSPTLGPFLTTLLCKVEAFPGNSFFVNLLVTELIASLAAYPQPLLKSCLINTSLVMQPNVKSLYQVLNVASQRIDSLATNVPGFETHLVTARCWLESRVAHFSPVVRDCASSVTLPESELTINSVADDLVSISSDTAVKGKKGEKKRRPSMLDIFSRGSSRRAGSPSSVSTDSGVPALEPIGGKRGYRFRPGHTRPRVKDKQFESTRAKNIVYAAVVLEEFCKELSALCREQGVQ